MAAQGFGSIDPGRIATGRPIRSTCCSNPLTHPVIFISDIDDVVTRNKLLRVLFSHIEQALHSNKDQGQHAHGNTGPPGTQGAIKLEDGNDGLIDQNSKQGTDHIPHTTGQ